MAQEALVKERVDDEGNRWTKAYFGGGEHFKNWLEQCRELGEVIVEEVDSTGYKCFEEGGEKLYRIWMKNGSNKVSRRSLTFNSPIRMAARLRIVDDHRYPQSCS